MTDAGCPPPPSQTPFEDLTPGAVLDALDAVCLHGDGRLIQLNSYENRVFQVYLETGEVVVPKFYRPGRWTDEQILEEHSFSAELAAAEIPVVSPLALQVAPAPRQRITLSGSPGTLAHSVGQRYSVSPRRAGRAPELEDSSTLEWIGRFIGRMHAVGCSRPFAHRGRLDIDTYGRGPRDYLLEHDWLPPQVLPRWLASVDTALDEVQRAFDTLPELRTLRLHGDCHPGNILWSDAGPHFVDLDDALTGAAVQDLWMLLSGDRADMTRQLAHVLAGYRGFFDFDRRELHLVEALRTLRLVHYAAWLARRWDDPACPAAFPWFNTHRYWQDRILELREQIALMDEPPLAP